MVEVARLQNRDDGAEDLFAGDAGRRVDICEDRRSNVVAIALGSAPACNEPRLTTARLEIADDLVALTSAYDGCDVEVLLGRPHAQRLDSSFEALE